MASRITFALAVLLTVIVPFEDARAEPAEGEEFLENSEPIRLENTAPPPPSIGGTATLGAFASEDTFYGSVEALIPVAFDGRNLFFLYPEISSNDHGQQFYSIGAGYRVLLERQNVILGINLFYDNGETMYDNHVHRFGVGGEILGEHFTGRLNFYFADGEEHQIGSYTTTSTSRGSSVSRSSRVDGIVRNQNGLFRSVTSTKKTTTRTTSTSRTFERFEKGMDGLDAELGARMPIPEHLARVPDIWLYAGYYNFQNEYGSDADGFRGRAEFRFGNWLTLDVAYYGDSQLVGSNWYGGARVHIPFGGRQERLVGWAGERGLVTASALPYGEGASDPNPLLQRMTENIIRESQTQSSQSGFIENPAKRSTSSGTSSQSESSNSLVPIKKKPPPECPPEECEDVFFPQPT